MYLEDHVADTLVFFCDNADFKRKIKIQYPHIYVTDYVIGHTGLHNTTDEQIFNSVTEFYILTQSERICAISQSGFSLVASKFKNIPLIQL